MAAARWFPPIPSLVLALIVRSAAGASAQTPGPATTAAPPLQPPVSSPALHVDVSLMNAFDGNIDRTPAAGPVVRRGPGTCPPLPPSGFLLRGLRVALNEFTGGPRWDRVSHAASVIFARRPGRFRFDTSAEATWKVPSDDGELTKQIEAVERFTVSASPATSVQFIGSFRYRYYVEHTPTSGISPYAGVTLDHHFGQRHASVGYRFQSRESRLRSDRYRRHGLSAEFATPVRGENDSLSLSFESRPQTFEGLVASGDGLVHRRDGRVLMFARYRRPLGPHVSGLWVAGFQKRWSNDLDEALYRSDARTDPRLPLALRSAWPAISL